MAIGPVPWLGPLLMISLWGSSAPGRRILRVRQGLLRGPGLTLSPPRPTASLLRRLGEHIQRFQESSGLGLSLDQGGVALPKERWLDQPLDPFNASDRRSFLQVRPGEGESTVSPAPFLSLPTLPLSLCFPFLSLHLCLHIPLPLSLIRCLLSESLMAL